MPTFPMTRDDMLDLVPKGGVCAEVGVFVGDFSRLIYARCRPEKLHLIDGWDTITHYVSDGCNVPVEQVNWSEVRDLVAKGIGSWPNVEMNIGDSVAILGTFPDRYFDFVYIDAAHSYENCTADIRAAVPKIKVGGLLGGHDLCPMFFPGVVAAVMDAMATGKWELVAITNSIFASWLLRRLS